MFYILIMCGFHFTRIVVLDEVNAYFSSWIFWARIVVNSWSKHNTIS